MKKQLVRLTENDLHRIIKESVNNILTELDWRTLASAEEKAGIKAMNAKSPQERKLATMQSDNFAFNKAKKQQQMYDGVDSNNYEKEHEYPTSKTDYGKFSKFHYGFHTPNGAEKTSLRKQLGGASKIAQFNRGEDEYRDGKWRKKIQ